MTSNLPRVCIFTPTQRPGFDVSLASVVRQEMPAEIMWIISDQIPERSHVFREHLVQYRHKFSFCWFHYPKLTVRNLAKSYNYAVNAARNWEADIFISMQDYIWAPSNGIESFYNASKEAPDAIFTGLTHISSDPTLNKVWDIKGHASIFHQWYWDKPQEIAWRDPRERAKDAGDLVCTHPIEWETNWAAIGRAALYDPALYFDESYDEGVAYENQDYAYRAKQAGYEILIDSQNEAISLPHKEYFTEEWNREQPLTQKNRELSESKWGAP